MRIARLKPIVFLASLLPFLLLVWGALAGTLGANPIDKLIDETGTWTLRFVLLTLLVTPLRRWTGWNDLVRFRRMIGLFAFFYGAMHLTSYVVLDQFFAFSFIAADIAKRPFITVGFTGFVLMIPLAATSTAASIRRLGGRRWQRLHRLVYVTAAAGVLHYYALVKADTGRPGRYAIVLAVLLGVRAVWWLRKRVTARVALRAPLASASTPGERHT